MTLLLGLWIFILAATYTATAVFRRTAPCRPNPLPASDPATLADLARAALLSGASLPAALEAVDTATGEECTATGLALTARLLVLGNPWEEAWAHVPPRCALLRDALEPSWEDGAAPVPLLTRAATSYRSQRSHLAREAAAELGTRLVLPLTLCFLPAFIFLGVVPVIASAGLAFFGS